MASLDENSGIVYNTIVGKHQIVIDTSVLVAALRSRRGASYQLLMLLGSEKFEINLSVPLVLEYESAAKRLIGSFHLTERDIDHILDYICRVGNHQEVYYLWRPLLKDSNDDMVLELAVAGGCAYLVTYNRSDFAGAERFGIRIVTPLEFLQEIGEL